MAQSNSDESAFGDNAPPGQGHPLTPISGANTSATHLPDRPAVSGSTVAVCLLLFLLVVCAFLPSLRNGFVNFDDDVFVYENSHVSQGLCWESIRWAFRNLQAGFWQPLTWLSLLFDSQMFGLRAGGYHLTSLLLHAVNTVLLFAVFRRMTGATWRSALVAVLFALHPLHVESVAWISERKDVLSTLFWMLTMLMYVRYVEAKGDLGRESGIPQSPAADPCPVSQDAGWGSKRARPGGEEHGTVIGGCAAKYYALALVFFVCGLMSKTMVVTLPAVLLLLDWWPLRRFQPSTPNPQFSTVRRLLLEKLPFLIAAFVGGVVTLLAQSGAGALRTSARFPISDRLANATLSYAGYLGQTLWPLDLAVYYPYPRTFSTWAVVMTALLFLLVSAFVLASCRLKPYLAFGWVWYVVTLLPVSGLIQVGGQARADRYTYLPLVGVFAVLAWSVNDLTRRWRHRMLILRAGAIAMVLLCLVLTERQLGYWNDGETLFHHSLAVTANNAVAQNNLGAALLSKRRPNEALAHFEEGIRLAPDFAIAHYGLGDALVGTGRFNEAISQYRESLRLNPNYADAHTHLGRVLSLCGLLDDAIDQFQEAVTLKPGSAQAHYSLGTALLKQQRVDEAIRQFEEALRLAPKYTAAHSNLGASLGRKGRVDEAIVQFQEVLRLTPADPGAHCNLADALALKGRLDEAIGQYREALNLAPDDPAAHGHLADSLVRKDLFDEAIREYREAIRLKPDYSEALAGLHAALTAQSAKASPPPTSVNP